MKTTYRAVLFALLPIYGFLAGCSSQPNWTQAEEAGLITALEAYKQDTGAFPAGSNAAIIAALKGGSPSKRVYIAMVHRSVDGAGNLLDAWSVAYQFETSSDGKMVIRSAGPDGKFLTGDDLIRNTP